MVERQEQKYLISGANRELLYRRLQAVLTPDPHAIGGGIYRVRTLYFDNIFGSAMFDTLSGAPLRAKYRLRMYNLDPGFIRLEQKIKQYQAGGKPGANLSPEQARSLLRGDVFFLYESGDPFLQKAYAAARAGALRPRCIVDYTRAAFCHTPGNVRVTLDWDIRISSRTDAFFVKDSFGKPATENGTGVLEVKYDHALPDFLRALLAGANANRSAFSKYALSQLYD